MKNKQTSNKCVRPSCVAFPSVCLGWLCPIWVYDSLLSFLEREQTRKLIGKNGSRRMGKTRLSTPRCSILTSSLSEEKETTNEDFSSPLAQKFDALTKKASFRPTAHKLKFLDDCTSISRL